MAVQGEEPHRDQQAEGDQGDLKRTGDLSHLPLLRHLAGKVERRKKRWTAWTPWSMRRGTVESSAVRSEIVLTAEHRVHNGVRAQRMLAACLHVRQRRLRLPHDRDEARAQGVCVTELALQGATPEVHLGGQPRR